MAKERHQLPGDARQTEIAPLMEHGAPEKILPVDDDMKKKTPHFQFTSI